MTTIPLTQGQFACIDDADLALVGQRKWYAKWSSSTQTFYAYTNDNSGGRAKTLQMHRIIMGVEYGDRTKVIDHENGNTLDNRRKNLVVGSLASNNRNKACHRQGMLIGRAYHPGRRKPWQARITIDGVKHSLGYFETEQEAHERYMEMIPFSK